MTAYWRFGRALRPVVHRIVVGQLEAAQLRRVGGVGAGARQGRVCRTGRSGRWARGTRRCVSRRKFVAFRHRAGNSPRQARAGRLPGRALALGRGDVSARTRRRVVSAIAFEEERLARVGGPGRSVPRPPLGGDGFVSGRPRRQPWRSSGAEPVAVPGPGDVRRRRAPRLRRPWRGRQPLRGVRSSVLAAAPAGLRRPGAPPGGTRGAAGPRRAGLGVQSWLRQAGRAWACKTCFDAGRWLECRSGMDAVA